MPPKRANKPAAGKDSQYWKQIDDFIGDSELKPGQESQEIKTTLEKKRARELTKKYF